jgi:hypothetical protein
MRYANRRVPEDAHREVWPWRTSDPEATTVERSPEQQLKYAKGQLKKESKLYDHFVATAVVPPADIQKLILQKQAAKVERWKQEIERLQASAPRS